MSLSPGGRENPKESLGISLAARPAVPERLKPPAARPNRIYERNQASEQWSKVREATAKPDGAEPST